MQAGVAFDVFKDAQDLQKRYEVWVDGLRYIVNPNNEIIEDFRPSQPSLDLGFYRQQDRPEVYLVYRSGYYCHVYNEDQMNAFGGLEKVRVVNSLNLKDYNTSEAVHNQCQWPNGFFRESNNNWVYRLYGSVIPEFNIGDSFCHVANEDQMNAYGGFEQVRVISRPDPSLPSLIGRGKFLATGRTYTAECPW